MAEARVVDGRERRDDGQSQIRELLLAQRQLALEM